MTLSGELLSSLSESKRNDPSFRKFAVAVAQVIEECDAIDDSIIGILELWAAHCQRPGLLSGFVMLWVSFALGSGAAQKAKDRQSRIRRRPRQPDAQRRSQRDAPAPARLVAGRNPI